jgi:hypothetical protein
MFLIIQPLLVDEEMHLGRALKISPEKNTHKIYTQGKFYCRILLDLLATRAAPHTAFLVVYVACVVLIHYPPHPPIFDVDQI